MSRDKDQDEWLDELNSFMNQEEIVPPRAVTGAILSRVKSELNPSPAIVATKLFGLHAVSAMVVVLFCPQLGVGPLLGGMGLMSVFMRFGALPCAALCGAFFLGTSAVFVTLILKREELRFVSRHRLLHVSLLAALSLGGLMLFGEGEEALSYFVWLIGAVAGGWIVLSAGSSLREAAKIS